MEQIDIILQLTDRIRELESENKLLKLKTSMEIVPLFNFKIKRIEKRMTMNDVFERTGISTAYLCQLETGKITNPSYRIVKLLYELYN
jgi:hypothetical protein